MPTHESNGFFPVLIGGLGNQLFILVAAYVCGRVHGCNVYLPSSIAFANPHLKSKQNYITTLFHKFGIVLPDTEENLRSSVLGHYKQYNPRGFGPWFPHEVIPGTYMNSYFQFYPPLSPYENDIRTLFLQGLGNPEPNIQTAFLHIRRGDYLNNPQYHYIQNLEYYEKALCILKEKNPSVKQIKIFSDDIVWAKEQSLFKSDLFSFSEQEDEIEALQEMTQCHGGAVLANSTFSWWGAFLGPYAKRAPIIYPSRWIAEDVPELCPKEWIRL
jgi:hypothetical protein